jgi:hypothetical protein
MNTIKFSFKYPKLYSRDGFICINVKLLEVINIKLENLSQYFLYYDTNKSYNLPPRGNYLLLLFQKNDYEIFTTLRSNINEKEKFYRSKIGEFFKIEIKEVA